MKTGVVHLAASVRTTAGTRPSGSATGDMSGVKTVTDKSSTVLLNALPDVLKIVLSCCIRSNRK